MSTGRIRIFLRAALVTGVIACATTTASAAIYSVSSIPDLQARIDAAMPGDIIVVRRGVYTTGASITVGRQGTASAPIRILAQWPGAVEITGTRGFNVVSPAT